MTYSKSIKLEVQIEVNMPLDIIEDKHRLKAIETRRFFAFDSAR